MKLKIGFSTSQWWVSRVIRFFTRAPVSHTYVVFEDATSPFDHEVYEAAWCGFRMSTRQKLASGTTRIVKEFDVTDATDVSMALGVCRRWLETPYAYAALVGEAWVQVGKWLGRRWANPFPSPHAMFCSEAATYLLQMTAKTALLRLAVRPLDARATDPYMLDEALTGDFPGDSKLP